MDSNPPRILAVCTGNICRSPVMERLFRARLSTSALVASAGTGAMVGSAMAPGMTDLLHRVGVPSTGFKARQVTDTLVDDADLILTATVSHRSKVVDLKPQAMHYAFTLLEFAIPLSAMDVSKVVDLPLNERIEPLIEYVLASRPRLRLSKKELDVPDPYGHEEELYTTAFSMIYQAVATITYVLTVT